MTEHDLDDLEQYRWTCPRALNAHGKRTAADFLAEIPADSGIDRYGAGGAVRALEDEMRTVLAKPAAVFMPSGTMAQQIALRIHADRRAIRTIAFHPTSHLELHEDQAYQRLHGLVGLTIGNKSELITVDDLRAVREPLAAVLFELPQLELGGRLPSWSDLQQQIDVVRARGAAVHLDGARIWECTPYYDRSPAEIAASFDTVYVSFYKGLGGLAGCCLAGAEDVIDEARSWRRRHGGTLFGLWPNAASGLAALRKRLPLMRRYYEHACDIADALRGVANVKVAPDPPQTPLMHLHLHVDEKRFRAAARRIAEEEGIFTWTGTAAVALPSIRGVELTVGDATLAFSPGEVVRIVERLANAR